MSPTPHLRRKPTWALAGLVILIAGAGASSAEAQSIWLDRTKPWNVMLQIDKPFFEGVDETFATSVTYLDGRYAFASGAAVVGELGLSHFGATSSFTGTSSSETGFGNPYLGLELGKPRQAGVWGELGLRIPLASDEFLPLVAGLFDDTERWETWPNDVLSVRGSVHYRTNPRNTVWVDLRVAPILWVGVGDLDGTEFFATYGISGQYSQRIVRVGAGLSGRISLSADDLDLGESTVHQLDLNANFLAGHWRPGVLVRLPLDADLTDTLDAVVGLTLEVVP